MNITILEPPKAGIPFMELTWKALEQFNKEISNLDTKPYGIRIGVKGGGCSGFSWVLDFIDKDEVDEEDDKEYQLDGLTFIIDVFSQEYLQETKLDYTSSLKESGFKFSSSKISRSCGCGSSFSM